MVRVLSRASEGTALAILLTVATGCGSAHLATAKRYEARGNLPLAIEILDAGVTHSPGDAELKDALILVSQTYQRQLGQDVERLVENSRPVLALRRLILWEELARRASQIPIPTEDPSDLENRRRTLARQAIEQLGQSLDERAGRGHDVKADLATCRQLLALLGDDPSVANSCDRIRRRFKLVVILSDAAPGGSKATDLFQPITATIAHKNPELLEVVDRSAGRHNASLQLFVGDPELVDTGWVMVDRDAFHDWVPKRTKKGKQVEETVVVQPTKKEIEETKKKKKPAPKPKKKSKKVYEPVAGEFRHFRSVRTVSLSYRVVIEDLRDHEVPIVISGHHRVTSESRYHEYSGDGRGRELRKVDTPYGRRKAAPLASARDLTTRVLREVPETIVKSLLERIE